jgi:hypothetical protein
MPPLGRIGLFSASCVLRDEVKILRERRHNGSQAPNGKVQRPRADLSARRHYSPAAMHFMVHEPLQRFVRRTYGDSSLEGIWPASADGEL